MTLENRTIIVSNIKRCWNLNRDMMICEMEYVQKEKDENEDELKKKKKKKSLIALSSNENNEELRLPFILEKKSNKFFVCDPETQVCVPLKCDPKKEKCDPYYYRLKK